MAGAKYLLGESGDINKGCEKLVGGGSVTKDMTQTSGSQSCNGRRCPPCFTFLGTQLITLTLANCHQNAFSSLHGLDVMTMYVFTNLGHFPAVVTASEQSYILSRKGMKGSSLNCHCAGSYGTGILSCDATSAPVALTGTLSTNDYTTSHQCLRISADVTIDNRISNSCPNGIYCPNCYFLDTSSSSVALTISYCSYWLGADLGSYGFIDYEFANIGGNSATVSDGTRVYSLAKYGGGQSAMRCECTSENVFICNVATQRTVSETFGVATMPESLSVIDRVSFSSSLSVRSFTRLGDVLRMNDHSVQFSADDSTYAKYTTSSATLEIYVGHNRLIGMTSSQGTLHGTWHADNAVVVASDVRLKSSIEPLEDTLRRIGEIAGNVSNFSSNRVSPMLNATPFTSPELSSWILEQLRPVSFILKANPTQGPRFGFIADEVQNVLPSMVAESSDDRRLKHLYITDLFAILVLNAQFQNKAIQRLAAERIHEYNDFEMRLSRLEKMLHEKSCVGACCRCD